MTNSINWIGIDDHADKLTIAQYASKKRRRRNGKSSAANKDDGS
jgi:hypothetical protein